MQGFKEYFGLGFFQGALLKDPKKLLVQLGQVHAGRVMKFTSAKDITAKAATIKAYVREAIAVEKSGLPEPLAQLLGHCTVRAPTPCRASSTSCTTLCARRTRTATGCAAAHRG